MRIQRLLFLCAVCSALVPAHAGADWFVSPFIGGAFGGGIAEGTKIDYGAAAGWMGRLAGFEVDVSQRPDLFEAADVPDFLLSESSVTTLMFNGLLSVPLGTERVRPYAAASVGCALASGATMISFAGEAATSGSMPVAASWVT